MELIAAMALFGIVMTIAVPVVTSVASVREETRRRQMAQVELGNLFEQIAARHRSGEPVAEFAPTLQLAADTAAFLPGANLTIEASAQTDGVPGTLVTARLSWTNGAGRPAAPAELSAYFRQRVTEEVAP
jgi:type II secretory pathway pseudopilin PulG